ncbi:NADH-quinone oxidoreductase subunit C [Yinghuangia sp. YIM S10712]|uniref:NADH-quinone oxidoreductase subunit C n=1 Tax=Yinghuangia sp. YIM S10712 TaxID=3436930 RepID=UPI003F53DECB
MTPDEIRAALGDDVTVSDAYGLATADVPAARWIEVLTAARDVLGLTYFDWLSGVDEAPEGFAVVAHVCAAPGPRLLLRTRVPRETPHLPTATGVYAGAAWHERETAEMFGVVFDDHPHPVPLLLPDGFEGHPLRKDFVLASRVAKPWPGAKEPGESDAHEGAARSPGRRRTLPPGVPDPAVWGPDADRAPATSDEPAAAPRAGRTPGDRPPRPDRPRRTRSASQGSASQRGTTDTGTDVSPDTAEQPATGRPDQPTAADRPRRARKASDGSASQRERSAGDSPSTPPPGSGDEASGGPSRETASGHEAGPASDTEPTEPPPSSELPPEDT